MIKNPSHLLSLLLLAAGFFATSQSLLAGDERTWKEIVAERTRLYGHRNWIVIADAAYPAQSRNGIETIAADAGQVDVLRYVLETIDATAHIRPIVYNDAELSYVPEDSAPGISKYREELGKVLGDHPVEVIPHEEIIAKLDEAGATFRVLIIKTNLALPYTSVFLELDCGYWNEESEKHLREAISTGSQKVKTQP
jgi:L-fucose mutarotase/ribose pyranase (RbsD/FucU family)